MSQHTLAHLRANDRASLYELKPEPSSSLRAFVVSTPESRLICNDPFITGLRYTELLRTAVREALILLHETKAFDAVESDTVVLHILRGGLNFGIREALGEAFGWNDHSSAFISAQRARVSRGSDDWIITENAYRKLSLNRHTSIVFGDVVATGTSLKYGLHEVVEAAHEQHKDIRDLTFFTIGGTRSHELVRELEDGALKESKNYTHSTVVYFEGVFEVAGSDSPLTLRIPGTDLLRSKATLAPEFIESQYEQPSYPLERCTIYDAGSRAFQAPEYRKDVQDYWTRMLELARRGRDFASLLSERFPELDPSRFGEVSLEQICQQQLEKFLPKRKG
ncbi:MAG: hypothetical protein KDD64_06255 [Bdellovibrionales bacterium]|nr:hypothetical protein [Bdellovibrionales bacterium]